MATGLEARVQATLHRRLSTVSLTPSLPIAWPNKPFTPPAGGYLRPTVLPARPRQIELGEAGRNRVKGIFQVDVFWPENKLGEPAMEIASSICAHFKRGTELSTDGVAVTIDEPPWPERAPPSPGWYQIPVSIPYTADVENPS